MHKKTNSSGKSATLTMSTIENGVKNTIRIELFPALPYRRLYRPWKPFMFPRPPHGNDLAWWQARYRLKINNRWHNRRAKYVFYTGPQAVKIAVRLLNRKIAELNPEQ
jgi:hypothetical protein